MTTRLNCTVGVDLGSTTSKAILLDENMEILGRGITNSRSNYDVASTVARNEALADARFTLVQRSLGIADDESDDTSNLLAIIESAFREQQYRQALEHLYESSLKASQSERLAPFQPHLDEALGRIFDEMRAETSSLFVPGRKEAQQFFRDLASSSFSRLVTDLTDRKTLPFDLVMSIYDKAIIEVENLILDVSFGPEFMASLNRALEKQDLSPAQRQQITTAVQDAAATELVELASVGTGYGRARLPFPKENIRSEILCHGLGAHHMFPGTVTVLDIGGQDTKAIQLDENGIVTSFHMNDRCAAGCGRYLGYIADEMNLGLHELGPLALESSRSIKINSTCTVFAGAELRERLSLGQKREDILAGLHRAIILRALSLLARAGGIKSQFTFTGGVARNQAAVKALMELVKENYGLEEVNISPESIYTGALGAALFAWRGLDGSKQELEEAVA